MAKDFRANQTRTHKIIGSGSNVSAGVPSILVYSASSATDFDGSYETNMLASVGSDVFLFVSGAQMEQAKQHLAETLSLAELFTLKRLSLK